MSPDAAVLIDELREIQMARALINSGRTREIRLAAGVTLSEIARAVGVSAMSVSRWEKGRATPRGKTALRYGRALRELLK